MNDEANIPEVSVILAIGLMLVVFGAVIVSWLIMLMTAGVFWRIPLPRHVADQFRLGLSVLFDTRAALVTPPRPDRREPGFSALPRRQGPTAVS